MKEALRAYLIADAGVAAVAEGRVSWVSRPRGAALPAVVLHQISGVRHYAMAAPSRLVTSRVQVDCWALSNKDASRVARAVNSALGGLRLTTSGVQFQGVFLESEQDMDDAGDGGTPAEMLFRVSMDFIIWHDE